MKFILPVILPLLIVIVPDLQTSTKSPCSKNAYWLYTRNNPTVSQVLVFEDERSVYNSNFRSWKDTVFIAHGWISNGGDTVSQDLTQAFLENGDVNVIVVDWRRVANKNYLTVRQQTEGVGRGLGKFIMWLTAFGLEYEQIHLVGYSLGGHLVGNAGKETGGRVGRITALDPANLLYFSWNSDRLLSTDAQYVEVIHTSTFLGYSSPCGDADFYPNGGSRMPGCWLFTCSHRMAYKYMASSVRHNHMYANECDSLKDAERNKCNGTLNLMGNSDIRKSRHGIFRINTDIHYPY